MGWFVPQGITFGPVSFTFIYDIVCRFSLKDTGFAYPSMQMTPMCICKQAASLAVAVTIPPQLEV